MMADGLLPKGSTLRSSKYLNNQIEQDHRGVKLRIAPMLGFKRFDTAAITIAGIELLRRILRTLLQDLATLAYITHTSMNPKAKIVAVGFGRRRGR